MSFVSNRSTMPSISSPLPTRAMPLGHGAQHSSILSTGWHTSLVLMLLYDSRFLLLSSLVSRPRALLMSLSCIRFSSLANKATSLLLDPLTPIWAATSIGDLVRIARSPFAYTDLLALFRSPHSPSHLLNDVWALRTHLRVLVLASKGFIYRYDHTRFYALKYAISVYVIF